MSGKKASLRAPAPLFTTREEWLGAASALLGAHFWPSAGGHSLPEKLTCLCGFPYKSKEAIGQCWSPSLAADGTTFLFICPTQDDPVRVLDILLHEQVHAAVGTEAGHGPKFRKVVKEFGLAGKATATVAEPGSELHGRLQKLAAELGPYPHAALHKGGAGKEKKGKKTNGWLRLMSINQPEYRVTISPKQLEEHGAPQDPWGEDMVPVEEGE